MEERILMRSEKAYKNMEAVAKMLTATSINGSTYRVEDVYFDYGQDWKWTTICGYGRIKCMKVDILSPEQWKDIVKATTIYDLLECAEDIQTSDPEQPLEAE